MALKDISAPRDLVCPYYTIGREKNGFLIRKLLLLYSFDTQTIYKQRCKDGKRGWIDFEKEMSTIIQSFDVARRLLIDQEGASKINLPDNVLTILNRVLLLPQQDVKNSFISPQESFDSFNDLRPLRSQFPEGFQEGNINDLLNNLNQVTRLLEIYLVYYVGGINVTTRLPEFEGQNFTHVLSFNYTDTFQRLYDPERKAKYCYIHGEARKDSSLEKCNMVLGIDEYLDPIQRDSENYFIRFKKFFQRIYKDTNTDYEDWCVQMEKISIQIKLNPIQNDLYIFGHSLDVTDKDIISKLILGKDVTTHIYFYNDEDKAMKIENLVKIIGEVELIKRTQGTKRTIEFIRIGKKQEQKEDEE